MFSKKIKTIVKLSGMSCEHCASRVKEALSKLDGVRSVKVDLENQEALLISNMILDKNVLKETIEKLDFGFIDIIEE